MARFKKTANGKLLTCLRNRFNDLEAVLFQKPLSLFWKFHGYKEVESFGNVLLKLCFIKV